MVEGKTNKEDATDSQSSVSMVSADFEEKKFNLKSPRLLLIFAPLLLLIIGGVVWAFTKDGPLSSTRQVSNVCSEETLIKASTAYQSGIISELQDIATHIKTNKDYNRDVDCLYVVAESEVLSSQFTAAQSTIDKLIKLNKSDIKFSESLDGGKASVKAIQQALKDAKDSHNVTSGRIDRPL